MQNEFDSELVKQFDSPEILDVLGQPIRMVDVKPKHLKTQAVTIFVPGFSAVALSLKDPILSIAEQGRRVVSFYAPHGVSTNRTIGKLSEGQMRKYEVLEALINEKKLTDINIVANSEAAIHSTVLAVTYPDLIKNVVLVAPAGLVGKDNIISIIGRFMSDMRKDKLLVKAGLPSEVSRVVFPPSLESGFHAVRADLHASFKEIQGIVGFDLAPVISEARSKGVKFAVIHPQDDRLFPLERVRKNLPFGLVEEFKVFWGSHNAIYGYKPYGELAEKMLCRLEESLN